MTDYRGLMVRQLEDLRGRLRAEGIDYIVVKNTLARRAAVDARAAGFADVLVGPVGLAIRYGDLSVRRILFDTSAARGPSRSWPGSPRARCSTAARSVPSQSCRRWSILLAQPSRCCAAGTASTAAHRSPTATLAATSKAYRATARRLIIDHHLLGETNGTQETHPRGRLSSTCSRPGPSWTSSTPLNSWRRSPASRQQPSCSRTLGRSRRACRGADRVPGHPHPSRRRQDQRHQGRPRVLPASVLKEAKDLVHAAPKAVREAVARAEADSTKAKLEEAGATVRSVASVRAAPSEAIRAFWSPTLQIGGVPGKLEIPRSSPDQKRAECLKRAVKAFFRGFLLRYGIVPVAARARAHSFSGEL